MPRFFLPTEKVIVNVFCHCQQIIFVYYLEKGRIIQVHSKDIECVLYLYCILSKQSFTHDLPIKMYFLSRQCISNSAAVGGMKLMDFQLVQDPSTHHIWLINIKKWPFSEIKPFLLSMNWNYTHEMYYIVQ